MERVEDKLDDMRQSQSLCPIQSQQEGTNVAFAVEDETDTNRGYRSYMLKRLERTLQH